MTSRWYVPSGSLIDMAEKFSTIEERKVMSSREEGGDERRGEADRTPHSLSQVNVVAISPLYGGGSAPVAPAPRMDGAALLPAPGSGHLAIPLSRCSHSSTALDWITTPTSPTDQDLFELLSRLQSSRLDDQRCSMPGGGGNFPSSASAMSGGPIQQYNNPNGSNNTSHSGWPASRHRLEAALRCSPPYPMVVLPPEGGFWCHPTDQRAGGSYGRHSYGAEEDDCDAGGGYLPPYHHHHHHHHSLAQDSVDTAAASHQLDESPCRTYRAHFLQSEHFNFCGLDDSLGPLVVSIKYYSSPPGGGNGGGAGENDRQQASDRHSTSSGIMGGSGVADHHSPGPYVRIILRLQTGTVHRLISPDDLASVGPENHHYHHNLTGMPAHAGSPSPLAIAKMVSPDLTLTTLQPVLCPRASDLLLNYDEHVLVNNFKFGVIYQKVGQTSEEALFGNRHHSPSMDRFLDMIGRKILLSDHTGYRGGLDTQFGQTGEHTYYTDHQGKEIMYHVATLLPYSDTDTQQLQRKRHIGNDIVSIVFQEGSTPFTPDMVTSHFLHAYIVVQQLEGGGPAGDRYRVSVTARSDVPYFGPSLPSPAVFRRGPEFREWLLTKLINAETACYKAEKFSKLEQRTRTSLLTNLVEDLTSKTSDFLGVNPQDGSASAGSGNGHSGKDKHEESGGIFKTVKKAFASRTKSQAPLDLSGTSLGGGSAKPIPKSKSSSSGFVAPSSSSVSSGSTAEDREDSASASNMVGGRRHVLLAPGRRNTPGKSDSGRGSVGTASVTSSTGRGSSPISSSSSPDLTARMSGSGGVVGGSGSVANIHSESDTSSLNSMEYDQHTAAASHRISPKKRTSLGASSMGSDMTGGNSGGASRSGVSLDPNCQEVVSGSVTMVTLEGNAVAGQLSKLQDEISKLKVDKLELLRQNVAAQREVKRLRERELQLQSDLTTASREINRLRLSIKQSANSAQQPAWSQQQQQQLQQQQALGLGLRNNGLVSEDREGRQH